MRSEDVLKEIIQKYGEWLEMGHSLTDILLQLLVNERNQNEYYKKIMENNYERINSTDT